MVNLSLGGSLQRSQVDADRTAFSGNEVPKAAGPPMLKLSLDQSTRRRQALESGLAATEVVRGSTEAARWGPGDALCPPWPTGWQMPVWGKLRSL